MIKLSFFIKREWERNIVFKKNEQFSSEQVVGRLDCFIELIESYFKLYFLWSRFRLNWGAQSEVTEWRKNVIFWKKKKKNFDFWFFFWEKCFEVSITISSTKIIRNFFGCGRKLFKITLQKDFLKKKKVTRTAGVKEFQNEKKRKLGSVFPIRIEVKLRGGECSFYLSEDSSWKDGKFSSVFRLFFFKILGECNWSRNI